MIERKHLDDDLQIRHLPLSKITDNPYQPRKRYPAMEIKRLAKNISERGLMQPVSVVEIIEKKQQKTRGRKSLLKPAKIILKDEVRYVLVAGHRRVRAFKRMRRQTIPAIIRKKSTMEDLALDLAVENAMRKDFGPVEKAQAVFQVLSTIRSVNKNVLVAYSLISQTKLCNQRGAPKFKKDVRFSESDIFECRKRLSLINMSENTACQYLRLLELPKNLQEMVISTPNQNQAERLMSQGYMTVKQAYELTRLKDPKLRQRLYEKMLEEKWRYIHLKYVIDELLERGANMNCAMNLGTAKARLKKEDKLAALSKSCFNLAGKLHNTRPLISRMAFSLDKAALRAAIFKLREMCLYLADECSATLREDDGMRSVNVDFELDVRKGKTATQFRFALPYRFRERLKPVPGDRLVMKIMGVIRGNQKAVDVDEIEDEHGFKEALRELA